jgi:hypothetical protein
MRIYVILTTWKTLSNFISGSKYLLIFSILLATAENATSQVEVASPETELPTAVSELSPPHSEPGKRYWLAEKLVHGHLALSAGWLDKPAFHAAPDVLTSIGAPDYITRHVSR